MPAHKRPGHPVPQLAADEWTLCVAGSKIARRERPRHIATHERDVRVGAGLEAALAGKTQATRREAGYGSGEQRRRDRAALALVQHERQERLGACDAAPDVERVRGLLER